MSSWPKFISGCKSRLSAIARSCFLGREQWAAKFGALCQRYRAMRSQYSASIAQLKHRQCELEQKIKQLEGELEDLRTADAPEEQFVLPDDPKIKGQQYGAKNIELAVNLGRVLGLRPAIEALTVVYEALGIDWPIPVYQTLRVWMQRIGIARIKKAQHRDDWIWIVDLSIQVGKETFMGVLGIPEAKLPQPGNPICLDDVCTLAIKPISGGWNKRKVSTMYKRLAKQFGRPVAILTDGADELRTPVKSLEKGGKPIALIRDVKHYLANLMKKILTDNDFNEFSKAAYSTHSKIQQTEMGHLAPPMQKQKARFMNLEPLLNWGQMVLWQFKHPSSDGRKGIPDERLENSLGWIKNYEDQIARWAQLQDIVSATLSFTNGFGLYKNCARDLKAKIAPLATSAVSRELVKQIISFMTEQEKQLGKMLRLPCSTEILESAFGKFKQLEKQHAHGGFTPLLAAFPTLLRPVKMAEVIKSFGKVKVKDIAKWVDENLPKTLTARIHKAYDEYRNPDRKPKRAMPSTAMT